MEEELVKREEISTNSDDDNRNKIVKEEKGREYSVVMTLEMGEKDRRGDTWFWWIKENRGAEMGKGKH